MRRLAFLFVCGLAAVGCATAAPLATPVPVADMPASAPSDTPLPPGATNTAPPTVRPLYSADDYGFVEEPEAATPASVSQATLGVAVTSMGAALVDGSGMTLYIFIDDPSGRSTCYGSCARTWPPLLAPDPLQAGEGVDASLMATITRDDGGRQVTYAGKPLYRYGGDRQPGDTRGQGQGRVWFMLAPDGTVIR
jgi:predicted lipoprotein with Yx(FWY)xxD motif